MKRLFTLALCLICADLSAHLNHIQFAAIDESGGKLRVRYRMSADMFMSNLDADIKAGRLNISVKQQPIGEIIRQYFKSHLLLETGDVKREAESAAFEFDSKTSDWIADFAFDAPAPDARATVICDAFLENNPRTQTLARIDWRGEKNMFHFRTGNTSYVLGSSLQPEVVQADIETDRDRFIDGLARSLKAYDFLAAGSLVLIVLGQMIGKHSKLAVPFLALAASALLSADQCGREGLSREFGYAAGWLAVTLTAYGCWAVLSAGRGAPKTNV